MNTSLVLRQQGYEKFRGWQLWAHLIVVLIGFLVVGFMYYFSDGKLPFSKLYLLTPFIYSAFVFFYHRYITTLKLEVDEFGIHYQSGFPDFLQSFNPDWHFSWGEIQEVSHSKNVPVQSQPMTPLFIRLLNKTIKFYPMLWVDPEDKKQKSPIFITRHDLTERYENNPLIKLFAEKGFLTVSDSSKRRLQSKWTEKSDWTDINSSPLTLGMAIFFFASIFYFLFEVYAFSSEVYIETPPYKYNAIASVVAMIVSYLITIKSRLKNLEKIIFSILMGISVAAIAYPLLLRINQWADAEGLQSHTYTKKSIRLWEAESQNKELPNIKFGRKALRFWDEFRIGTTKEFELRKGGLGFYQLNMKPVREEQHTFYRNK